jgi:hypothetical protein
MKELKILKSLLLIHGFGMTVTSGDILKLIHHGLNCTVSRDIANRFLRDGLKNQKICPSIKHLGAHGGTIFYAPRCVGMDRSFNFSLYFEF